MAAKKQRQSRRGLVLSEAGMARVNRARRRLEMQARAARSGLRVLEVPVRHRLRAGGTSKVAGTLGGSLRAAARIAIVLTRLVLDGRGMPARERFEETM